MDQETLVTGGSTTGVFVGMVVLIVGVLVGEFALQLAGGGLALLSTFTLTAFLAGLSEPEGAGH